MARFKLKGKARRQETLMPGKRTTPTAALPGSEEKIEEMGRRAATGAATCQPGDAGVDDRRALEMLPGTTVSPGAKGHNGARRVAGIGDEEEIRARVLREEAPPKRKLRRKKLFAKPNAGLPKRLLDLRKSRGLTLGQLALKSGVSKSFLCELEAGKGEPGLSTLIALADAFGVPLDRLCDRVFPRQSG